MAGIKGNLLVLCKECHAAFNGDVLPTVLVLPSNLEYFIDYEKHNYDSRQAIANFLAGKSKYLGSEMSVPWRKLPTSKEFSRKYTVYPLSSGINYRLAIGSRNDRERECSAEPVAIILRSAMSMGLIAGDGEDAGLGLPATERNKLSELLNLWSRPFPKGASEYDFLTPSIVEAGFLIGTKMGQKKSLPSEIEFAWYDLKRRYAVLDTRGRPWRNRERH